MSTDLIAVIVESLPVVTTVVVVVEEFLVDFLVGFAVAKVAAATLSILDVLIQIKSEEENT